MVDQTQNGDESQPTISAAEVIAHIAESSGQTAPEGKMKKNDVYKVLMHAMAGKKGNFVKFPTMFHVKRDPRGERIYLEEKPGQVLEYVSLQRIIDVLSSYAETFKSANFDLTPARAKECAEWWAMLQPSLEDEIAPVRGLSEPGYTYHRLPFDLADGILEFDCPLFCELLGRMTNKNAFMAWIGSLFDPASDRQQYVWLYGEGRNGKSTLGRMLNRLLGPAVRFDNVPESGDKFWTSGLLGKRLIIFGDCNNYQFVQRGLFKNLTGGDSVRIEFKGQNSYNEILNTKFLFFSNEKPAISGRESDRRRAIFCEMGSITQNFGPQYEEKLWSEMPIFITECIKAYKEVMKNGREIPTQADVTERLVEENEEDYEIFVQRWFNVGKDFDKDALCTPMQMRDAFEASGIRNKHEIRNYKEYMARKHGIKSMAVWFTGGHVEKRYVNCTKRIVPWLGN